MNNDPHLAKSFSTLQKSCQHPYCSDKFLCSEKAQFGTVYPEILNFKEEYNDAEVQCITQKNNQKVKYAVLFHLIYLIIFITVHLLHTVF